MSQPHGTAPAFLGSRTIRVIYETPGAIPLGKQSPGFKRRIGERREPGYAATHGSSCFHYGRLRHAEHRRSHRMGGKRELQNKPKCEANKARIGYDDGTVLSLVLSIRLTGEV